MHGWAMRSSPSRVTRPFHRCNCRDRKRASARRRCRSTRSASTSLCTTPWLKPEHTMPCLRCQMMVQWTCIERLDAFFAHLGLQSVQESALFQRRCEASDWEALHQALEHVVVIIGRSLLAILRHGCYRGRHRPPRQWLLCPRVFSLYVRSTQRSSLVCSCVLGKRGRSRQWRRRRMFPS